MKNIIGVNIKRLRQCKGWTQKEFAKKCSYNVATISMWERGISLPKTNNLLIIAKTLGIGIRQLLVDSEELLKIKVRWN